MDSWSDARGSVLRWGGRGGQPASFDPVNITATSGAATVTLANVLFGDVWVCSGQSNMQMPIGTPTCWNATNEDCKCTSCKDAQCGYGCVKNAGADSRGW